MMLNTQKGEEFRKYRDIAPEAVEDATIINLIQKSAGNHSAISAAIENMWHDLPDQKAVGVRDEWNTTSKSRPKKDVIAANQGDSRGGRGGRGRSMPPSGGRGQGAGGRGDRDRVSGRGAGASAGRGASTTRPVALAASSSQTTAPHQTPAVTATEQPVVSAPVAVPVAAPAPSNGGSGWGWGGTTLAQKLKQAEIQKNLPPPAPVVQVVVEEAPAVVEETVSEEGEVTADVEVEEEEEEEEEEEALPEVISVDDAALSEHIAELSVKESVAEVVREELPVDAPATTIQPIAVSAPVPEVVREREIEHVQEMIPEVAPKAFLKMGKWEAPLESSPFQFGSFGNYSSATNDDSISMSTPAPWGGVAESTEQQSLDTTAGVWGASSSGSDGGASASSSSGPSPMSSLFPAPKGLPSVPSDSPSGVSSSSQSQSGRYDQKPSAPPGLELHSHSAMSKPIPRQDSRTSTPGQAQSRGKHEANQQLQQQQQQQQIQQQQYQPPYQHPATVPPAAVRGNAPVASSPYAYAPGFEIQPQYQAPYQPTPAMPAPVAGTSPVAAAGTPSTQQASAAPQGQQQGQGQLQYGPPPGMPSHYGNPYYANPYYANPAYFYGQPQVQNPYYNQGRDYQASRPYGADPYAPGVQYPVYQQGGGFPDASGSYPNMPMQQQHPSMGPQGQGAATAPGAAAAGGQGQGKQQKGVGASSAAPQQQQQQDLNQGYVYNPYNPRDAQWQYQQAAPGWGAPMMGFPGGPGQSPPGAQGFSQGQPPQSAGQGQRPSASYGGPPGQGHQPQQGQAQGQSFSRGPAPSAAGPSSGGGSGQHW